MYVMCVYVLPAALLGFFMLCVCSARFHQLSPCSMYLGAATNSVNVTSVRAYMCVFAHYAGY
jgi:hypothetical protein